MAVTLRAAYAKRGLLRMVAHRDMGTHLRRLFLRAGLPLLYSQGFNPRPRMHFGPPLPLGATCEEDWLDIDLDQGLAGDEFLERVGAQTLDGLTWTRAFPKPEADAGLQDLLQYARWRFEPYRPTEDTELVERLRVALEGGALVLRKRNKRGKLVDVDARARIRRVEMREGGVEVVMGASPSAPEGVLGLFDLLEITLPDLEEHPMTRLRIQRTGFLRDQGGELVPAIEEAP